jgi:hypothetical protein
MSRLWPAVGGALRRETRFHQVDRPAPLVSRESQPDLDHPQDVLAEQPAGRLWRRHRLGDQQTRPMWGETTQPLQHSSQEEVGLFVGHILVREVGEGVQEHDQPDRLRPQQRGQTLTEQRGKLPAGEGSDQMDPAQEGLWPDTAGLRHGHDRPHIEGHIAIDVGNGMTGGDGSSSAAQGPRGARPKGPTGTRSGRAGGWWAYGARPGRRPTRTAATAEEQVCGPLDRAGYQQIVDLCKRIVLGRCRLMRHHGRLSIVLVVMIGVLGGVIVATAHRDPCHQCHACPSDHGTYVCGDLGRCEQCPDNPFCLAGRPRASSQPSVMPPQSLIPPAPMVKVRCVIDGDTLKLDTGEDVRLICVDTPETKHPKKSIERFGKEATAFTKRLVEGQEVRLAYDQQRKDKYGRTLAYVVSPRWHVPERGDHPAGVRVCVYPVSV